MSTKIRRDGDAGLKITGSRWGLALLDEDPSQAKGSFGRGLSLWRLIGCIGSVLDLGGTPDPRLRARALAALDGSVGQALAQDGAAIALDLNRVVRRNRPKPSLE